VPGPTNTLLAAAGAAATAGRPPLGLAVAELAGYLVAIGVLATVGDLLTAAIPSVGPAIRLGLVVYLVALGRCLWRTGNGRTDARPIPAGRIFLATTCNPKATLFAFVLLPAGGAVETAVWLAGFAGVVLAIGSGWILFGHRLTRIGGRRAAVLVPKIASLALFAFAALIAERTLAALALLPA